MPTLLVNEKKFDPYTLDPALLVPKKATPMSQQDIVHALCKAYEKEHSVLPSNNILALSWAQVALENNRGKKIWNNNLGNQGPFRMDQEYYHHLRGGWPYRSFAEPEESGRSYWRVIKKCTMAFQAFKMGDPALAASALKKCNYYSSDEQAYSKSLTSLYYEAKSRLNLDVDCGKKNNR